ncbi:MAG: M67 family metallopeptidase [Methylovulum sp.]|nr:M67 family metallopeptidase [Methylovulum sp.]
MTSKDIQIPRKITTQLLHLAQLSPELEICGLIGSQDGLPTTCYPIANSAEQPQQRYLLDASEQIAAMVKMRNSGEDLFAIYHSHPNSPALPSATDVEMAAYPDALYLIISLDTKGVLEMRGFKIADHHAREMTLILGGC